MSQYSLPMQAAQAGIVSAEGTCLSSRTAVPNLTKYTATVNCREQPFSRAMFGTNPTTLSPFLTAGWWRVLHGQLWNKCRAHGRESWSPSRIRDCCPGEESSETDWLDTALRIVAGSVGVAAAANQLISVAVESFKECFPRRIGISGESVTTERYSPTISNEPAVLASKAIAGDGILIQRTVTTPG